MRPWTKSAGLVLTVAILSIMLVATAHSDSVHPAKVSARTASNTELTLTIVVDKAPSTATRQARKYVVRRGDTLSGIAARFGVRGGWPALYAANRHAIGPDPNIIHAGMALLLPGGSAPARYRVGLGDTLSGIAARFGVRGGWPALYAANRHAIGPDPNIVHVGAVLRIPRPAAPPPRRRDHSAHRRRHRPEARPAPPAGFGRHTPPAAKGAPASVGMPGWLKTMLLALGLLIVAAFAVEAALVARRGRRRGAGLSLQSRPAGGGAQDCARPGAAESRILLTDHDRLVVTRDTRDGTVCVLRPADAEPREILRVARLVLPEDAYRELAEHLGLAAAESAE